MKRHLAIFIAFCLLIVSVSAKSNTINKGKTIGPADNENPALTVKAGSVDVKKLSSVINSTSCEYPLYISEINSGLIYYTDISEKGGTSLTREFYFTMYDSTSAHWSTPLNISKEYSKFRDENKNMKFDELYITIDNDIYVVNLKEETFNPHSLNINTKNIECSPSLSPDGNTLYFVSERKSGYGGKDIYASERLSSGQWSTPYNLGKDINTPEDEESPVMSSDGATLYFSSKGHYSYGGYDIFESTLNDDGLWSAPEQLGAPVNSTSDDLFLITNAEGSKAFYSSDKMEQGNIDIYSVKWQ